jgi:hypothetical protein
MMNELNNEKDNLLKKITEHARNGNTSLVISDSSRLKALEEIIIAQINVIERFGRWKNSKGNNEDIPKEYLNQEGARMPISERKSAIAKGNEVRKKYIEELEINHGIRLTPIKGKTIFSNENNNRVGIAYASEVNPNRWFLGLPENGFEHAVLLCEDNSKNLKACILPNAFFQEYGKFLSRSNGQLKFNIQKRYDNYFVIVPQHDEMNLKDLDYHPNDLKS